MGRHRKPRPKRNFLLHPRLIDAQFVKLISVVAGVFGFMFIVGAIMAPQAYETTSATLFPTPRTQDAPSFTEIIDEDLPEFEPRYITAPIRPVAQVTRDIERTQPVSIVKPRPETKDSDDHDKLDRRTPVAHTPVRRGPAKHRAGDCSLHAGPRGARPGQADQSDHGGGTRGDDRPGKHRRADTGEHGSVGGHVGRDRESGSDRDSSHSDSGQRSGVRHAGRD